MDAFFIDGTCRSAKWQEKKSFSSLLNIYRSLGDFLLGCTTARHLPSKTLLRTSIARLIISVGCMSDVSLVSACSLHDQDITHTLDAHGHVRSMYHTPRNHHAQGAVCDPRFAWSKHVMPTACMACVVSAAKTKARARTLPCANRAVSYSH